MPPDRVNGPPRMPVGIQMFATITSKDHYLSLQKDLQTLTNSTIYYDTTLYCCDGNLHYSRLLVGLIFPDLNNIPSFTWMPDLSLLMPQYKRSDVERMVGSLLSMQAKYSLPEESDIMNDWTDAIDTIIDNLKPESVSKDHNRTATLHSAVTKETAVLHAAQDDDTDAVLVVNEENPAEDHNTIVGSVRRNHVLSHHQPLVAPATAITTQQPVLLMQSHQTPQHNMQQQMHHHQHQHHHQQPQQHQILQQQHHHSQNQNQLQQPNTNAAISPSVHLPNVPLLQNLPGVTLHPAGAEVSPKKPSFIPVNNEVQILPTPPKPHEVQIMPTPPKPQTFVPIPSKNPHKSQHNNKLPPTNLNVPIRSPKTPNLRHPYIPVNSAVQILPKRPNVAPVRPRQHTTTIQPKKAPIRVDPKPKQTPPKPPPPKLTPPKQIPPKPTPPKPIRVETKPIAPKPIEPKPVQLKPVEVRLIEPIPTPLLSPPIPPKPSTPKPTHPFSCTVCHEKFKAQDVMENHMKIHSDKHKCQTCGLVCTKARELIEHQRIHSGAKLVKCNICDKDFTEKGLKLHADRFHKVEKKSPNKRASKENVNYMEDKITFTSSSESEPDEPEVVSEDDEEEPELKKLKVRSTKMKRSELCEMCDKYFTKKGMKLHVARYHKDDDEDGAPRRLKKDKKKNPPLKKLFTCGFCEKKFSHLASMKVHEKVHLGGKPHQCDMCEAKFSNKFDLFAHEKTHSALRPHKCDECTETFKTAESLRFHKLIHVESQPNICRFCKKCFKNKNQLDLHERVHTGEKPFKCTQCDFCFETASKLTRHITGTHMS